MSWFKKAQTILDLSSMDNFRTSLGKLRRDNPTAFQKLSDKFEKLRAEKRAPIENKTTLFHGTTTKRKDNILENGFQNTEGERSGFMGATYKVENQGVFLTDNKELARFFGNNRANGAWDTHILECYVDVSNVLDAGNPPREVVKAGLKIINDYNGTQNTRIPKREWWWLMDQPEFVEIVKNMGFTGIKFQESPLTLKEVGSPSGNTFLIFNPSSITLKQNVTFTVNDFIEWLKNNPQFLEESQIPVS